MSKRDERLAVVFFSSVQSSLCFLVCFLTSLFVNILRHVGNQKKNKEDDDQIDW
jgi:hypothetical protein